jgi:hypothetical protein
MKNKLLLLAMSFILSAQTIKAQLPSYIPTNGLVGYWPFNGNANDNSGNNNNGIVNQLTWGIDRFGIPNSTAEFNGDYRRAIRVPNPNATFNNEFTYSFWLKINTPLSYYNSIIGALGYCQLYGPYPSYISAGVVGKLGFSGYLGYNNSNNTIDDGNWHPGVMVVNWTGGIVNIYIDGILNATSTFAPQVVVQPPFFEFGQNYGMINDPVQGPQNIFAGELDDIGIWNRALSQQEITNLYNANQCITNITVTDTLIINVGQLSFNDPVTWANNITIAPNPASSQININFNNITNLNGGTLKIINSLGQEVSTTPITTSGTQSTMQLVSWGGTGMYFVQIINPQGQIVDIKKIILQ